MQIIEEFEIKKDLEAQLTEYLNNHSGYTVVDSVGIKNQGYETAIVVFDDGQ